LRVANKGKIVIIVLIGIITLNFLSACDKNDDSQKGYNTQVLRVAYGTGYTSAVFQIMMSKGILQEELPEDVSVERVNLVQAPDIRDAMIAGKVDIGTSSTVVMIAAQENELPLVILTKMTGNSVKIYSANTNIKSLDDIKMTDKIAVTGLLGVNSLAFMLYSQEKYANPGQFSNNLINMQYEDMFSAVVATDELDCIITGFPYNIRSERMKELTEIVDLTPTLNKYGLVTVSAANKDFYADNPVLIEAFNKATDRAIAYMNDNPEEASKILSDLYEDDIEQEDVLEQLKVAPPDKYISESAYNELAKLMYEVGILENQPKKLSDFSNYADLPKTE